MPGRQFNNLNYRYGFNGKENDNGVHLDANGLPIVGSQQDYGMRIYNAQLCRFLSVDPLTKEYCMLTPYQFASNRPIDGIDLDGLEYATFTIFVQFGKVQNILTTTDYELKNKATQGPGIQYHTVYLDAKGKVTNVDSKFVKNNIYGIYAGSENPKLPKIGGHPTDRSDDYRLKPIDEVDAAALKHDLAYDKKELRGFPGIMNSASTKANEDAVNESGEIIDRYWKEGTDKISGKKISTGEKQGAELLYYGFKAAEKVKASKDFPSNSIEVKTIDNFIEAVGDFIDEVKFKTTEGLNSINNYAPH